MDYFLDLTSFTCPLPLLMSQKALKQLNPAETLTLMLNNESTINDIKLLCQQQNYQLLNIEQINRCAYRLTLQK
ncbi:MAG: sulfurtransferase TusA family protein [Pasteurella oralis]|uniref:sulfurtransferase TusA family protein n=1 Tax=Pasteurella oralis TaxID=1071947 RepID=UPI002711027E|nr:sulfurtransferase TusA family protein [Pasteurella oralis]